MNGEMYQIASIVAAAKMAIKTNKEIKFTPTQYENSIKFEFLPKKIAFTTKKYTASNVSEWFGELKKKGLQDIKLLCPYAVKDRYLLGFSNTTESLILCFFKNAKVTYFVADWKFDSTQKKWNILYSEYEWENAPSEKPHFENNIDSFRKVLSDIQKLAFQIECENFANVFGLALQILNYENKDFDKTEGLELLQLPSQNLKIFTAANRAYVFGAMGSWNDSPPYMAHEKGLDKEYETLSSELLKNIRLAILYSVNEW